MKAALSSTGEGQRDCAAFQSSPDINVPRNHLGGIGLRGTRPGPTSGASGW